jgi:hypothetical protein
MKDDYSRSNDDYIKYSDKDISQINVREAYDWAPTLYMEEEPLVLQKQLRLLPKGYLNARDSMILV